MEIERRAFVETLEVRAQDQSAPIVRGYAATFNSPTEIAGLFREQIAPGAFRSTMQNDDVMALFNHDPNYVLGRTKNGTLRLSEDQRGLHYEVTLNPDDPDAVRVHAKIQRGDVSGSSFGFVVEDEKWDRAGTRGQLPLRTIRKAKLTDVSPVTYPAYPTTTVSVRSKAESVVEEAKAVAEHEAIERREELRRQLAERQAWRG